jgi:hypothetical protein
MHVTPKQRRTVGRRGAILAGVVPALLTVAVNGQPPRLPLADGTRVKLRLVNVITSETSTVGDALEFVVVRDVVLAGQTLIRRRTSATGSVVAAEPLHLGFIIHPARLAFRFDQTTALDGQAIRLRASSAASPADSDVVVDQARRHHRGLQWADGTDLFDAFVDGDYLIQTQRTSP